MNHALDCPAYELEGSLDYDPEACRGGDCPAAIASSKDTGRWAPFTLDQAPAAGGKAVA